MSLAGAGLRVGAWPELCIRVVLPLLRSADIPQGDFLRGVGQREYTAPACMLGGAPRQKTGGRGASFGRYLRRLQREAERSIPLPRARMLVCENFSFAFHPGFHA